MKLVMKVVRMSFYHADTITEVSRFGYVWELDQSGLYTYGHTAPSSSYWWRLL